MKTHPAHDASEAPALILTTSWGEIRIAARCGKIIACTLPFRDGEAEFQGLEKKAPPISKDWKHVKITGSDISGAPYALDRKVLLTAENFVKSLLAGRDARRPPVRLPEAADFTTLTWREMMKIPFGQTRAYGDLAAAAGRPRAARAAGTACATNQIPLFVPCHRILGTGGALGGFSSGLAWKKYLLRCEGSRP